MSYRDSVRKIQHNLTVVGFPLKVDGDMGERTKDAILQFKRGYARKHLRYSPHVGMRFTRALRRAAADGGHCSEHFHYRDFACHDYARQIKLARELVIGLEKMRRNGMTVSIIDGYRSPEHNHNVGGEPNSMHLYGSAADIAPHTPWTRVRDLHVFSGIGYEGRTGLVRHVDVRGMGRGSPATTPGTPLHPTTWQY